jgi:hypothetical protein
VIGRKKEKRLKWKENREGGRQGGREEGGGTFFSGAFTVKTKDMASHSKETTSSLKLSTASTVTYTLQREGRKEGGREGRREGGECQKEHG